MANEKVVETDEMFYRAITETYDYFERVKREWGHPMHFLAHGDYPLPPPGTVEEAKELIKGITDVWLHWRDKHAMQRMSFKLNWLNADPVDRQSISFSWQDEPISEEEFYRQLNGDREKMQMILLDLYSEWALYASSNWPKITDRVLREYKSRTHHHSKSIKQILDDLNVDLVGSTELTRYWDGSPQRTGQVLRSLGHQRVRTAGTGDNQYIWIIKNHDKYRDMKPREVRAAWLNISSKPEPEEPEKEVSFF